MQSATNQTRVFFGNRPMTPGSCRGASFKDLATHQPKCEITSNHCLHTPKSQIMARKTHICLPPGMSLCCFMTPLYHLHDQGQHNLVAALTTMRRERRQMYGGRVSLIWLRYSNCWRHTATRYKIWQMLQRRRRSAVCSISRFAQTNCPAGSNAFCDHGTHSHCETCRTSAPRCSAS